MAAHWIAVAGNSPGAGKSTLCTALARRIGGTGAVVDHFQEADILTRPAFRAVAEEFAAGTGSVHPATLTAATRAYAEQARTDGVDVLVTDALIPFVPSLVAWGHHEQAITEFVCGLAEAVEPTQVTVLYLRDDPETALRRAVGREGPQWADWYVGRLQESPGTGTVADLASAAAHLRRESRLTLRVLGATRWNVIVLDIAGCDAEETERYACEQLHGLLGEDPG